MNQDLPEPDFSFDCDGTPCYYASTVRSLIAEAEERGAERGAREEKIRRSVEDAKADLNDTWGAAIRARGEMK